MLHRLLLSTITITTTAAAASNTIREPTRPSRALSLNRNRSLRPARIRPGYLKRSRRHNMSITPLIRSVKVSLSLSYLAGPLTGRCDDRQYDPQLYPQPYVPDPPPDPPPTGPDDPPLLPVTTTRGRKRTRAP